MLKNKWHLFTFVSLMSASVWASDQPRELVPQRNTHVPASCYTAPANPASKKQEPYIEGAQLDQILESYLKDEQERKLFIEFMGEQSIHVSNREDIDNATLAYFQGRGFSHDMARYNLESVHFYKSIANQCHRSRGDFMDTLWPGLTVWQKERLEIMMRDMPHQKQIQLYMIKDNEAIRNEIIQEFNKIDTIEGEIDHLKSLFCYEKPANLMDKVHFVQVCLHKYESMAFSKRCHFSFLFDAACYAYDNNKDLIQGLMLVLEESYHDPLGHLFRDSAEIRKIYFQRQLGKVLSHNDGFSLLSEDISTYHRDHYAGEKAIEARFAEHMQAKPAEAIWTVEDFEQFWCDFFVQDLVKDCWSAISFASGLCELGHIFRSEDGKDWYSCLVSGQLVGEDEFVWGFSKAFGLWYAHACKLPVEVEHLINKATQPAFGARAMTHMLRNRMNSFSPACEVITQEILAAEKQIAADNNYVPALPAAIVSELAVIKVLGVDSQGILADYEDRLLAERLKICGIFN